MDGAPGRQKTVCPWWLCFTFDNPLRRLAHSPEKILRPFVREGDRAIDVGAGMGYFTIPLARIVGSGGWVTAIDLQAKMLSVLRSRAGRNGVSGRIETYRAEPGSLGRHDPADFVLAFWMVHEVPDQGRFLDEIRELLRPGGRFLLVEPKMHVSRINFAATIKTAEEAGFAVLEKPRIRLSRSALFIFPGRLTASSGRA